MQDYSNKKVFSNIKNYKFLVFSNIKYENFFNKNKN